MAKAAPIEVTVKVELELSDQDRALLEKLRPLPDGTYVVDQYIGVGGYGSQER